MTEKLQRKQVFPEASLPDFQALVEAGRHQAKTVAVGGRRSSETTTSVARSSISADAPRQGRIMMHAQIGFRDPAKSRRAWA